MVDELCQEEVYGEEFVGRKGEKKGVGRGSDGETTKHYSKAPDGCRGVLGGFERGQWRRKRKTLVTVLYGVTTYEAYTAVHISTENGPRQDQAMVWQREACTGIWGYSATAGLWEMILI